MKHEIDLSKYELRTDLAIELINDEIKKEEENYKDIKVTNIYVDENIKEKIKKKVGNYITIEFKDITDTNNKKYVQDIFVKEMKKLLNKLNLNDKKTCLVIGLGNNHSTPDSLGPNTIDKLIITNHLYEIGKLENNMRRVAALNPGVMAETGIETSDIIKSVAEELKPDFLIVVDALASSSIERINKTIQITDTGIHPGSGIGNSRKEISKEILNIPVIAIGVPTTVDAVTIVSDTINYMTKKFSYTKQNINNPMNKLIVKDNINYLNKNIEVKEEEKKEFLGLVGNLTQEEIRLLINEVLTPIGYNLMVTPKEIDFLILKLADIIGNGLNEILHNNL